MKQSIIVGAVALVAGLAIGSVVGRSSRTAAPAADDAADAPRTGGALIAEVDGAGEAALRARIQDLESRLARAQAASSEERIDERPDGGRRNGRGERGGWPSREEMRANFEKWKAENPEEFARMEKRRQEFMQRRAERAQSKIDFLSSVDTSGMSRKAKETHESLQALIAQREELEAQVFAEETTDDQRDEIFRQMRETDRAIREANAQERENLLQQTAEALGFSGAAATEIVDTISEIYEATSEGGGRGPGGPGGPGGGLGGRRGR